MKQLLIAFFIIISFSVQAQQPKKDSVAPVVTVPADSVKIISKENLEQFIKFMRENVSVNSYEALKPHEVVQQLYFWYLKEYATPSTKKK